MNGGGYLIDGKAVRKFLFARRSKQSDHLEMAQVEAHDKDHAVRRLAECYPHYDAREWEFIEELDPEHEIGMLGKTWPLGRIFVPRRHMLH
jgi:hypothetical protein